MITCHLMGGLGNQLFQVAAGLVVQFTTGKQLVLPQAMPHIHSSQRYEESIFRNFLNRIPFPVDDHTI